MRLIDADALKRKINERYHDPFFDVCINNAPTITPDSLVKRGRCELCEDYDNIANMVCYIPSDNGYAKDIPVKFCPVCGGALMED